MCYRRCWYTYQSALSYSASLAANCNFQRFPLSSEIKFLYVDVSHFLANAAEKLLFFDGCRNIWGARTGKISTINRLNNWPASSWAQLHFATILISPFRNSIGQKWFFCVSQSIARTCRGIDRIVDLWMFKGCFNFFFFFGILIYILTAPRLHFHDLSCNIRFGKKYIQTFNKHSRISSTISDRNTWSTMSVGVID